MILLAGADGASGNRGISACVVGGNAARMIIYVEIYTCLYYITEKYQL